MRELADKWRAAVDWSYKCEAAEDQADADRCRNPCSIGASDRQKEARNILYDAQNKVFACEAALHAYILGDEYGPGER